ncbi:hypothetical protein WDW37_13235 [Bdellovibrionota bacterium FG-1]
MIEVILGNKTAEKVLLYLANYDECYAKEVATVFDVPVFSVQKQLLKFEAGGILVSQLKGKTRMFSWNPRFALRREFLAFLKRALALLPDSEKERYFTARKRPR